mmetsp:Transcript_22980/g.71287  ORF Transcript_22980/g.71287 Transcript_22980/m.71287 type:complete len:260 (-) Transcript_22980:87-866(-)
MCYLARSRRCATRSVARWTSATTLRWFLSSSSWGRQRQSLATKPTGSPRCSCNSCRMPWPPSTGSPALLNVPPRGALLPSTRSSPPPSTARSPTVVAAKQCARLRNSPTHRSESTHSCCGCAARSAVPRPQPWPMASPSPARWHWTMKSPVPPPRPWRLRTATLQGKDVDVGDRRLLHPPPYSVRTATASRTLDGITATRPLRGVPSITAATTIPPILLALSERCRTCAVSAGRVQLGYFVSSDTERNASASAKQFHRG